MKAKDWRLRGFRRSRREGKTELDSRKECPQVHFATWLKTFGFLANSNCFERLRKNRIPISVGNVIVYAFPTNKKPSIFTGKARHRHVISGLPQVHEGMWSRALTYLASVTEHVGLIQTRFLTAATVQCDLPVSVAHVSANPSDNIWNILLKLINNLSSLNVLWIFWS